MLIFVGLLNLKKEVESLELKKKMLLDVKKKIVDCNSEPKITEKIKIEEHIVRLTKSCKPID